MKVTPKSDGQKQPIDSVFSPLILVDPAREQVCIGTVFIIGAMGAEAIGITARHSIEYAMRYEPPNRAISSPGTPFLLEPSERQFSRIELRCMLELGLPPMLGKVPAELEAIYSHKDTDIAYVHLRLAEGHRDVSRITSALPVLSTSVKKGEPVRVVGFHQDGLTDDQRKVRGLPQDAAVDPAAFSLLTAKLKTEAAEVVELLQDGYLDCRFPMFRVNCAFESGLSGGAVLVERDGEWVAAGMICRDHQEEVEGGGTGRASGLAACAAVISASLSVPLPDVKYQSSVSKESQSLARVRDLVDLGVLKLV